MASVTDIRKGLEDRLKTIKGLRVYRTVPDTFAPPAAVVIPESGIYSATYNRGSDDLVFNVQVIASRASSRAGQDTLDAFIDGSGDYSVIEAIYGDDSLGGVVDFARVVGWSDYGQYNMSGEDYLGVVFRVEVTGHG